MRSRTRRRAPLPRATAPRLPPIAARLLPPGRPLPVAPAFLVAPGVAPANVRNRKEAASALTGAASCISIRSKRGSVLTALRCLKRRFGSRKIAALNTKPVARKRLRRRLHGSAAMYAGSCHGVASSVVLRQNGRHSKALNADCQGNSTLGPRNSHGGVEFGGEGFHSRRAVGTGPRAFHRVPGSKHARSGCSFAGDAG